MQKAFTVKNTTVVYCNKKIEAVSEILWGGGKNEN